MMSVSSKSAPSTANVPSTQRQLKVELLVLLLIVAVGVASRFLLDDLPNFKPVAALALFGGFYFQRQWLAVAGLVGMMLISDFFLGSYPLAITLSVYFSLGLGCWLGQKINSASWRSKLQRYAGVTSAAFAMACIFFVVTNLAVWTAWYPATSQGLATCFVAAIPFFKYTLAGNLIFSIGLFGIYDVVSEKSLTQAGNRIAAIEQ